MKIQVGVYSHTCAQTVSLTTCVSLSASYSAACFSLFSSQYPGVAESIRSDIDNLMAVLKMSVALPEGDNYMTIWFSVYLLASQGRLQFTKLYV